MAEGAKKLKVLHFTCTIRRGGRERQIFTIYKHCPPDIQNRIVSLYESETSYLTEYDVSERDLFFIKSRSFVGRVRAFNEIIKSEKPDIIYAWDNLTFIIARVSNLFFSGKIINGSVRHGVMDESFFQRVRSLVLWTSKHIIANSKAGLKANRLNKGHVIYNGIDDSFFDESEPQQKLAEEIGDFEQPVFVSVANLVPYKDYSTVLKSLATLKHDGHTFTYLIIGEGPNRESIQKQIIELNLSEEVHLLGKKINVRDYLLQSDLFIHSSKGEGCSNAILEAMACGLPVVASNTGGTSEIVDPEFSRLFEYLDSKDLENQIKSILNNNLAELGKSAKKHAENRFTVSRMVDDFTNVLNDIARD